MNLSFENTLRAQQVGLGNKVQPGVVALMRASGKVYKCVDGTPSTSVWAPADGLWDPRDWGVVGENKNDDTLPLQACVDAANSFRSAFGGGAVVGIPPLDIRVTDTINVPANITIVGAGKLVSRIRAAMGVPLLQAVGATQVRIAHLGLTNGSESTSGGKLIDLSNTNQSIVHDVDIRQCETGVHVRNGSENCRVANIYGTAFRDGIIFQGSSNGTHAYGCRINNASRYAYHLTEVSQCGLINCEAEGIEAGATGYNIDVGGGSAISNMLNNTRAESGSASGTGYSIGAGVQYTHIFDPYWPGVATPIVDSGIDTWLVNRGRFGNGVLLAENVFQSPGDTLGRLRYRQASGGNPEVWELLQQDIAGALVAPVLPRRSIAALQCGSANAMTGGDPHYMSWIDTTGSGSIASARAKLVAPLAGRMLKVTIASDGNLGSTDIGLHVNANATPVASATATVGSGGSVVFELSTSAADQHWSAGDVLTVSVTPTNSPTPTVVLTCEVEWDRRP